MRTPEYSCNVCSDELGYSPNCLPPMSGIGIEIVDDSERPLRQRLQERDPRIAKIHICNYCLRMLDTLIQERKQNGL